MTRPPIAGWVPALSDQSWKTTRAGTVPASTSSMDWLTSSILRSTAITLVRPAACRAKTSARSLRVPTIEPMTVLPLMTVSKIGRLSVASSAGSATHTRRPAQRPVGLVERPGRRRECDGHIGAAECLDRLDRIGGQRVDDMVGAEFGGHRELVVFDEIGRASC